MTKSRSIRYAGLAVHGGEKRNWCTVLVGKPEGKRALTRCRRRWDYLKMDLMKDGTAWAVYIWYGEVTGCCELGNKTSVSVKGGEFLEQWRN